MMKVLLCLLIFGVIFLTSQCKTWPRQPRLLGVSSSLFAATQHGIHSGGSTKIDQSLDTGDSHQLSRFDEIKSMIEESESIDEVLHAAEEIPAMQRSSDRALKIRSADVDDAVLALRVLFKISNFIASSSQNEERRDDSQINDLSVINRVEHVADCVALNLRSLSSEDLIVAAWSLNTIKLSNQGYIEAVMNEYGNRMVEFWADKAKGVPSRLRIDDIAAMIWTVGSHRDQYGWSNITLIDELVRAFAEYNGTAIDSFAQLDPRMNIRILWAMSLFNILRHHQEFATHGVSNILPYLSSLTSTNKVSTLWCVARARLANASVVVPVIETVNQMLVNKPNCLREHELNYVLLSAKIINERMRRLLMDHKCNLTAMGMANSHLALDEAMILNATEKLLRSIVVQALPTIEEQSFQANLNILRVLGRMELLDEDQAAFKAYYDRFREKVETALSTNFSFTSSHHHIPLISPTDAADILELIATTVEYPGLLQGELTNIHLRDQSGHLQALETGQVVAVEGKTRLPKAISSSVGVSNMIQLSSASSHQWHELMGRLGVYITCYRKEISDRATFVHAGWALARMGHALKPLCRKVRTYAEYQQLSELPIQVLSRLVVVLASEQAWMINNAASVQSTACYGLIARVATTILARLGEVTLLSDLSQIVFSVAFLGRLPHYNKAIAAQALADFQQHQLQKQNLSAAVAGTAQEAASQPLQKLISLRPLQLMFLSTEEIIGLYWSTRQLAADNDLRIFDKDTTQMLIQEVQRRLPVYLMTPTTAGVNQSASAGTTAESTEQQTMNFKDSFLLVKSLSTSSNAKDTNLAPLKEQACGLLMQQCAQLFTSPDETASTTTAAGASASAASAASTSASSSVGNTIADAFARDDHGAMLSAADVQRIGGIMRDDLAGYQPLDPALETHVSVLIEALQAFIDLRWFKEDMITTCDVALSRVQEVLAKYHRQHPAATHQTETHQTQTRLADSHVLHFQYGVLSQLLSIYRELPLLLATDEEVPVGKMPKKKKPATMFMAHFPRLHGLFSRFLGTVPASVASDHPAPAVIAPVAPRARFGASFAGVSSHGTPHVVPASVSASANSAASAAGSVNAMSVSNAADGSSGNHNNNNNNNNNNKNIIMHDDDCTRENSDL